MEASSIIRRIDNLGRVAIPKELRHELRIKDGDPLEVSATNEMLIIKKHSELDPMANAAQQLCSAASKSCGATVIVTDRDTIIAMAGCAGRNLVGQLISSKIVRLIEQHLTFQYVKDGNDDAVCVLEHDSEHRTSLVTPIISNKEAIGSVIFLGDLKDEKDSDVKYALSKTIATFLGNL